MKSFSNIKPELMNEISIIEKLDSDLSYHSLVPVSYEIEKFRKSDENQQIRENFDGLDKIFNDLKGIKIGLGLIGDEITALRMKEEIKNVKTMRIVAKADILQIKVEKFNCKVKEMNEKILGLERIVMKIEDLRDGFEKLNDKNEVISMKFFRIARNEQVRKAIKTLSNNEKK